MNCSRIYKTNGKMDKVRVIMITYQGEGYFRQQLDSIVQQEGLESIHIYDDASTPAFVQKLTDHAQAAKVSIEVHQNPTNLGVIGNVQQALSVHQDAAYIALADQDDIWYPGKLKATLEALQKVEDSMLPCLAYHDMEIIDAHGQKQKGTFWESKRQTHYPHTFETNLISNVVTGAASLMNRAMIPYVLDLPKGVPIYHDAWMGMVAFALGKAVRLDAPLSAHRMHGASLTFARKPQHGFLEKLIRNGRQWLGKDEMFGSQFTFLQAFYDAYQQVLPREKVEQIESFLSLKNRGYWAQKQFIYQLLKEA